MNKHAGITVFILFFGLALIQAIEEQKWLQAVLFGLLGIVFLWSDKRSGEGRS